MNFPHRDVPALVVGRGGAVVATAAGVTNPFGLADARDVMARGDVIVCHAPFTAGRLGARLVKPIYDVLELFAFARPAEPCLPSPQGLASALALSPLPHSAEDSATMLHRAVAALLDGLTALAPERKERARKTAAAMAKAGWRWSASVLAVLGEPESAASPLSGYDVWRKLPEWEDEPSPGNPRSEAVSQEESQERLRFLIGKSGALRKTQADFTAAATEAFGPRVRAGSPRIALVEAGTGTGKTLGYLAPASLWAEKNGPGVWISTFTRNLQRQILQETTKLYPGIAARDENVVVRKGRENYLCLLNFEDAVKRLALLPGQRAVALGLIARWLETSPDGDFSGAGFPAFLGSSVPLRELTDRRGECIYAACPHYRVCFIERGLRRAKHASLVIANHALVMAQAMRDGYRAEEADDVAPEAKLRYVFDEGHHLFDAADNAFAAELSGREMAELRRWLRGAEGRRSRARGLDERTRELVAEDPSGLSALDEALAASGGLAAEAWLTRLKSGGVASVGENFLRHVYDHVRAKSADGDSPFGAEAETKPLSEEMIEAARALDHTLARLAGPLNRLAGRLRARLDRDAATLDDAMRIRLEAAARGIERRAHLILPAWRAMLAALDSNLEGEVSFSDWFEIAREDGRDSDVGLKRHWIDPTIPFAEMILKPAHGALITSATLRDAGGDAAEDWRAAEVRVGAHHLPEPPLRAVLGSPFDWARAVRIIVVRDIDRRDAERLSAAYRELFLTAGGGALGLFTAVRSLKTVHARIAPALEAAGLTLYAQHMDQLDTGTLVDLFRAEENACLLGTDALRDGVDVVGRSLRLCVFDKVPWPRPTILHKARRQRFGKTYDDQIARLRLKQAFGRLIRSETDKGVFVILDAACPTRLLSALPVEAPIMRLSLKEAVEETRRFLG